MKSLRVTRPFASIPDQKRLEMRDKVTESFKKISGVAQDAGVVRQGIFHNARYRGLYGMPLRDVKRKKRVSDKENLLDRAGALELSANDFQMLLAANVIATKGIRAKPPQWSLTSALARRSAKPCGKRELRCQRTCRSNLRLLWCVSGLPKICQQLSSPLLPPTVAAFLAISARFRFPRLSAEALPPNRPNATAAGQPTRARGLLDFFEAGLAGRLGGQRAWHQICRHGFFAGTGAIDFIPADLSLPHRAMSGERFGSDRVMAAR